MITCSCGQCRIAGVGEPGLWTWDRVKHITLGDGRQGTRQYRDEVRPGRDGLRRCPNCRDILNDDWSTTPAADARLLDVE